MHSSIHTARSLCFSSCTKITRGHHHPITILRYTSRKANITPRPKLQSQLKSHFPKTPHRGSRTAAPSPLAAAVCTER